MTTMMRMNADEIHRLLNRFREHEHDHIVMAIIENDLQALERIISLPFIHYTLSPSVKSEAILSAITSNNVTALNMVLDRFPTDLKLEHLQTAIDLKRYDMLEMLLEKLPLAGVNISMIDTVKCRDIICIVLEKHSELLQDLDYRLGILNTYRDENLYVLKKIIEKGGEVLSKMVGIDGPTYFLEAQPGLFVFLRSTNAITSFILEKVGKQSPETMKLQEMITQTKLTKDIGSLVAKYL